MLGKILIIEDDANVSRIFQRVLLHAGYQAETAANGIEGLAKVHSLNGTCSLILLDILMPTMGGIEFLQQIRKEGYETPVVVITQVDTSDLKGLDVFDIVPKPITKEQLLNTVARVDNLYKRLESEIDNTLAFLKHVLVNKRMEAVR